MFSVARVDCNVQYESAKRNWRVIIYDDGWAVDVKLAKKRNDDVCCRQKDSKLNIDWRYCLRSRPLSSTGEPDAASEVNFSGG